MNHLFSFIPSISEAREIFGIDKLKEQLKEKVEMLEDGNDFSGWQPMQCSTCKYFEETGVFSGTCHCEENGKKHVRGNDWCQSYKDKRGGATT